ncbi:hypothetical protein BXZ70DRAFT_320157 [Cristinia sonorae]|uniref:Uncharacterized protein n=1 Tax=Cristinia sonorae TaxID=1940300 RepID=A0A8K0ULN2_9AGAR|nr:hypothetical protein BXZ70DRAFT_320157 [Cristinia sonorae]
MSFMKGPTTMHAIGGEHVRLPLPLSSVHMFIFIYVYTIAETDEVEAAWLFNEVDDHLHSANTDPLSTSPGRYTWRAPAAAPAPIASAANRRPEISGMDGVRRRLPRLSMLDDHFEDTAPRYFRDRGDSGPGYLGSYQESAPEPSFRREDLPRRESRVPMVSASTTYLHRSEESSTSSDMYPPPLTRHDERLSPVTDSLRSRMLARLEEMDDPPHTYGELDVRAEETDIAPLLRARQAIRDEIDLLMERSNTVRRNLEARISRLGLGRPAIHSTYSRDRDIQSSTGISRSTPSESPFTFDWEGSDPTAEASTNPTHQSGTGDVGFTFDWDNRSCESSPHRLADPSPQSTEGPPFSLTWGDAEEDEVEALLSSARASRIHAHEATWSTPVVLQRYVETRRRSRDSSDNDWSMRDLLRDEHHSHLPSVSPRIIPVAAHTPDHSNSRTSIPSSASSTAVNDSRPPSHRTGHHYPSAPHSHIRHRHVDVDTRTPIPTASMPQASPNAGINLDRYHDGPFRASLERSERLRREREEMMQRITERDSIARQRVGSSYRSSGRAPSSTATSVSATDSPGSLPTQRVSSVADEPATFSRIARSRTTRLQHHHTHGLYPRHVRDDHRDIHDSITRQLRIPAARLLTPGRARDTDTLPGIAPDPSGNSEHQQQLIEDFRAQRSASASASADRLGYP